MSKHPQIAVVAGGVGAAKFLRGLLKVCPNENVTAIINIADDFRLHGLHISPDLDTVTYTLSKQVNPETGWGRADESWRVRDELERLGGEIWFNLGDLDLALHLYRTQRLALGLTLTEVTHEVSNRLGVRASLLPASNQSVQTQLKVADQGWVDFQDYFVAQQHGVAVQAVRFQGIEEALPGPQVIAALEQADQIIIAPSNPFVSVKPILDIEGIGALVKSRRDDVVAISPIVGGAALKGPASRMLEELGYIRNSRGVASFYQDYVGTLLIDNVDAPLAPEIESDGMQVHVTDTIMGDPERAAELARETLKALEP